MACVGTGGRAARMRAGLRQASPRRVEPQRARAAHSARPADPARAAPRAVGAWRRRAACRARPRSLRAQDRRAAAAPACRRRRRRSSNSRPSAVGAAVEDEVDARREVGGDMRRGRRRDMAGAVGRRRHDRPRRTRAAMSRATGCVRHAHRDRVEAGGRKSATGQPGAPAAAPASAARARTPPPAARRSRRIHRAARAASASATCAISGLNAAGPWRRRAAPPPRRWWRRRRARRPSRSETRPARRRAAAAPPRVDRCGVRRHDARARASSVTPANSLSRRSGRG